MLFLLLCKAAPAMCHPNCNDINSPRRVWIDIDSRILTSLMAAPAFALAPKRFRDLCYLLQFRVWNQRESLQSLAALHSDWFRHPELECEEGRKESDENSFEVDGSSTLATLTSKPPRPVSACVPVPPTRLWKLDCVVWAQASNTIFYAVLIMWGFNRFDRPVWGPPLFVGLALTSISTGRLIKLFERLRVGRIKGKSLSVEDKGDF